MTDYRLSPGTPALKRIDIPMDDVKAEQKYSLAHLMGECSAEGTTDTDSVTEGGYDRPGYRGYK